MKVVFDQNVPIGLVRVLQTFAKEHQFRRISGNFEIKAAAEYTPQPGDDDYRPSNDVPWLKRFADDGGKVVISGDTNMKNRAHERLALIEGGFVVIFFEPQWSNWKFWRKCALLIHWWPMIAAKIRRAKKASFYHVPCHWTEDGKLRWVSNKDPKLLKIERRAASVRRRNHLKQTLRLDRLATDHYLNSQRKRQGHPMVAKSPSVPRKPDDPEQSKAFIEKAREIGADEKHSAAEKLMERLAKTKPEPHKPKG